MAAGELDVAHLDDGSILRIPVRIAQSRADGKAAFISAGIHGNEINGLAVLHTFLKELNVQELTGTLIIIPSLNPWGFMKRIRYVPFDNKDLNRCFPGHRDGTAGEQVARTIHDEVTSKCDFGIDLHDAGSRNVLLPHPRVHIEETDGCTKEIGALFGTEIIMERKGRKGMMAVEAHRNHGIPVITAEIGGGLVLWDDFIADGVEGVRNILRYEGMLPGDPVVPEKQLYLSEREGYKASIAGILERKVQLGQGVKKGQVLARIYDPITDSREDIIALHDGVVLSVKLGGAIDMKETALSVLEFERHPQYGIMPLTGEMITNTESRSRRIRESKLPYLAKPAAED